MTGLLLSANNTDMDDNGIAGVSSSNVIAAPSDAEVVVEKDIAVDTSSRSDEENETTTTEASSLEMYSIQL
jgi:hypothetical protein